MSLPRPRVVISRCIEFDACRYNGQKIPSDMVLGLMPYVEFLPVCMEADMGLGVPRDPVRLVRMEGEERMVQPATGRDVTEQARKFIGDHLSHLQDIDGFLLKGRSPSCGVRDVKVYPPGEGKATLTGKAAGLFARGVMETFPRAPMEDEMRLLNDRIADHFLTRLFTRARFRACQGLGGSRDLMDFHADHKLLFMGYNQEAMRRMGRIAGSKDPLPERYHRYSEEMDVALQRPPRCGSWNNVLMHAMGYFSERLGSGEKEHFLQALRWHTEGKLPLTAPLLLVRSWSIRFDERYLQRQVLFEPYPLAFMGMMGTDSCTGRDLWKGGQ